MNSLLAVAMTCVTASGCAAKTVQPATLSDPPIQHEEDKCSFIDAWLCEADHGQDGYLYVCVVSRSQENLPAEASLLLTFPTKVTVDPGGQSGTFVVSGSAVPGSRDDFIQVDGFPFSGSRYRFFYTSCCVEDDVSLSLSWWSFSNNESCKVNVAGWQAMLRDCDPSGCN